MAAAEKQNGSLEIYIIGAGPTGIECALQLLQFDNANLTIFEAKEVASNVKSWAHVKLFSTWSINVSERGLEVLKTKGLKAPTPDVFPTGGEFRDQYLLPLSQYLSEHERCTLKTNTKVGSITRCSLGKTDLLWAKRMQGRFRLLIQPSGGNEEIQYADVVIDCSGVYNTPTPLGTGGDLALGERNLNSLPPQKPEEMPKDFHPIFYHTPNVEQYAELFANKKVVVLGAGMSAMTTLNNLVEMKSVNIVWLSRNDREVPMTVIENDPLPQRIKLCELGNKIAAGELGNVKRIKNVYVERIVRSTDTSELELTLLNRSTQKTQTVKADAVISNCGFRPNLDLFRELQIHLCYASEGPMKLAASLMGGSGDCLKQSAGGPDLLKNPEPGFYILGNKSYGRNSAYLLKLGIQQMDQFLPLLSNDTGVGFDTSTA